MILVRYTITQSSLLPIPTISLFSLDFLARIGIVSDELPKKSSDIYFGLTVQQLCLLYEFRQKLEASMPQWVFTCPNCVIESELEE